MTAGKTMGAFLIGLTAGAAVALLYAPKSGQALRRSLVDKGEDGVRQVRRKVRRSIEQMQDLVDRGNDKVTAALNTSKHALDLLADSID